MARAPILWRNGGSTQEAGTLPADTMDRLFDVLEQIGRARQAGADGYWIKPITPSQLVRFLQAGPARWPGLLKPPV